MLDIIIGGIIAHPWKYRIDNIFHLSDCVSFLMNDMFFIYRVKFIILWNALRNGHFNADAEIVAEKVATLIKKSVPDYLLGEWRLANNLASMPVLDAVVECLIEKGVLTPPEDGIGAEGCWMSVEK